MPTKKGVEPPELVWVSYCGRCGDVWGASRTQREAEHYSGGCACNTDTTIAVARYVRLDVAGRHAT